MDWLISANIVKLDLDYINILSSYIILSNSIK